MATIGFIGLGNMGGPMASNLVKAGHTVNGFDLVAASLETAARTGVTVASSAVNAVTGADVVITMLPAGSYVTQIYRESVIAAASTGALLIDCSTIDIESARTAHALASEKGFLALDAPVSGGMTAAVGGTLTFMVGGPVASFEAGRPILEAMGRRVLHCGDAGAGQAAKICNNMILGVSMIAVCEGFVLGEKLGLTPQALFDVISTSSGQCWAVSTYCPVPGPVPNSPANADYKPGFATALMLKDMRLAAGAAQTAGVDAALGRHAEQIYAAFAEAGHSGLDFSAVIEAIRARSGTQS